MEEKKVVRGFEQTFTGENQEFQHVKVSNWLSCWGRRYVVGDRVYTFYVEACHWWLYPDDFFCWGLSLTILSVI